MDSTANIGYLLHHLSATMARQSDQALQEKYGIGFSQFKILLALRWNDGIQQRNIADALGQTEASVSRQIKLMRNEGLISSKISEKNRRERIVALTPKGLGLTEKAAQVLSEVHDPVVSSLGAEQQQQLRKILSIMHACSCRSGVVGSCQAAADCQ